MEAHQGGDTMITKEMNRHIKGKRTKRRRPSSTLTLTLAASTTTSSTTTTTTTTTTTEDGAPANHIEFTNNYQENDTNNDQDIANCLMLLAHGHQPPSPQPLNMVMPLKSHVLCECRTCDRGFASFQALGGHKASHNKPHKGVDHEVSKNRTSFFIRPNKLLSCNPSGSIKGPKVHECYICGSDFTSGQALGGHMRRHRSMIMSTTTTATNTNTAATSATKTICNYTSYECHKSKKHKTPLLLDLNLPAPIEDDHNETKITFGSVFSTPSLIKCRL